MAAPSKLVLVLPGVVERVPFGRRRRSRWLVVLGVLLILAVFHKLDSNTRHHRRLPLANRERDRARCSSLKLSPGPQTSTWTPRTSSSRFVKGTPPVLLKNVTLWTGNHGGTEVINGTNILLRHGIIAEIGTDINPPKHAHISELHGAWVTPGIVDMHSHIGDAPSPSLKGTESDDNSLKGPILPWLRSIDGLNIHDASYELSIAGGVTTSLVLPGSANAIGGQAFPIKLRRTEERTPTSKLIEIPETLENSTHPSAGRPVWRNMKHACGENPGRIYGGSRMDTYWAFRDAYETARRAMVEQDDFCAKLESEQVENGDTFPENLQWEALIDVLRGRVKVHIHCYETVDLDAMIRISNEFNFSIAAFHHAHEAFLVPALLKKARGGSPAVAMFATNARYKREAYRGSEFAPKVLSDHNISVVMKSDHPVLDSRYLLYEAQQAHYYGLPAHIALSSVTSTPARVLGLDYRIGLAVSGHDADVVVWDSHPLALGATPLQVYIDGIAQLTAPTTNLKAPSFQVAPFTPDFSKEAIEAVEYDGLPPIKWRSEPAVLFTNVARVWRKHEGRVITAMSSTKTLGSVLVENGQITCMGISCQESSRTARVINLQGGSLGPALVTFGANAGLEEIEAERSTNDGRVLDPLGGKIPHILGGPSAVTRAVDGLEFGGRDLGLAYAAGVTTGIVAPMHRGFLAGLGTAFSVSATNKLERGAVKQEVTALHIAIHAGSSVGVSTQIAALRRLLLDEQIGELGEWFTKVAKGDVTLVVEVENDDIIATLISLKKEVERARKSSVKLTLVGASEAHILAKELHEANVGIILNPSRPFPHEWEERNMLPGPPLSNFTAVEYLLAHNVTVGIGILELWSCRNTRFDAAWAAIDSAGRIGEAATFEIVSTNLERLLGVRDSSEDLIATAHGSLLSFESKIVAVVRADRGVVDMF